MSHHYVFGKAGSRLLDLLFAICASALLSVPFGLLTLYIRYLVTRRFPEVAEERRRAARSALGRFLAPAFFCDSSRWVLRNGALVPGKVYKLETLNPVEKTLLLGQWSNLLRRWAVDELPQLLVTLTGGWSLFGPRSVPNRSGGLLTGGTRVDELRDYLIRYRMGGVMRKPGAISLRVAMTPRGSVEMPPWKSMLLCDRYDSSHWSGAYALRVVLRVLLSFLWAEAAADSYGPVESRVAPLSSAAAWGRSAASGG